MEFRHNSIAVVDFEFGGIFAELARLFEGGLRVCPERHQLLEVLALERKQIDCLRDWEFAFHLLNLPLLSLLRRLHTLEDRREQWLCLRSCELRSRVAELTNDLPEEERLGEDGAQPGVLKQQVVAEAELFLLLIEELDGLAEIKGDIAQLPHAILVLLGGDGRRRVVERDHLLRPERPQLKIQVPVAPGEGERYLVLPARREVDLSHPVRGLIEPQVELHALWHPQLRTHI